jgi:hypothetical protein
MSNVSLVTPYFATHYLSVANAWAISPIEIAVDLKPKHFLTASDRCCGDLYRATKRSNPAAHPAANTM